MPQESISRRSLGYRTFVTCEDPRGVAEYGTIKKPKITPTQKEEHEKKLESGRRRKHKNLAKGGVEEGQSPTSFHLLEVSRGAQKLNNVISSWSAGHSNNNSRDIAHDLLEGALDLKESLAMLSRLQNSPNYLSKEQQKQKIDKGWFGDDDDDDDLMIEEKDFVEDMKKVIRNGVGREYVFSDEFSSEEACSDRRLDAFDAPSTSSSQSSIIHSSGSKKKNKKTKRPNLIAKLMGLEDASLMRSLPYNPRKHMSKCEKTLKQKRPAFDPQQFNSKQRWSDDRPPIVILRPLRFSCVDLEQPIIPKSRGDVYDEMFLGMRIRTNPLAQTDECEALNSNEAKARERTRPGKPKSYKEDFVEKNAEEAQKVSESRSKGKMQGRTKYGSHLQSQKGRQGTQNKDKLVNKTALVANGNQRYKAVMSDSSTSSEDASQIEITVADYVVDDQSSPSETPLLFGNHRNNETALLTMNEYGKTDHAKLSNCFVIDTAPIKRENASSKEEKQLYSVCDHLVNGNQSQPFIKRVEELFDNNINHSEISARELLDTANELISLHISRCSTSAFLPITRCCCSSFERLLDEVCDEIKVLRRYRTAEGDNYHSTDNSLLLLVKGDLRTRGMVGGMWDISWMNAGSADEIQEITRAVQEMVLDGLIEEILF